jgi:hypothetical protein
VQATNAYGFSEQAYELSIAGLIPPRILSVRATNGAIRLEWTNYNPAEALTCCGPPNLTGGPVVWTNLGTVTVSPWTKRGAGACPRVLQAAFADGFSLIRSSLELPCPAGLCGGEHPGKGACPAGRSWRDWPVLASNSKLALNNPER